MTVRTAIWLAALFGTTAEFWRGRNPLTPPLPRHGREVKIGTAIERDVQPWLGWRRGERKHAKGRAWIRNKSGMTNEKSSAGRWARAGLAA